MEEVCGEGLLSAKCFEQWLEVRLFNDGIADLHFQIAKVDRGPEIVQNGVNEIVLPIVHRGESQDCHVGAVLEPDELWRNLCHGANRSPFFCSKKPGGLRNASLWVVVRYESCDSLKNVLVVGVEGGIQDRS